MSPKALVLCLASAALGATTVGDHIFPFSMPDASGSTPLAYSDVRRFDHHCFAFVYAVFDKKRVGRDENNQAFLERALPLCNGLLPQTECLFSLSELYKVRKGQGSKGSKKEWCQGLYEKVAGVEMPVTTTTKMQPTVQSTTSKAQISRVKSTTAAPKVKSTTAAAMPRVKSTTTPSAPLIKSTTTALAWRIKSTTSAPQSKVKSTMAASTTTTTTSTTTSTTSATTTTSTTATVAPKRSVKAGVDFMKHLRPPAAPLAPRAARPAVFTKSATITTTTTTTTTAPTSATRAARGLNAGVDFMRHLRAARALVAKASTTTTSSWPETNVECVCFHRDGLRICNCPEGKSPPPEGLVQGKLLAAAAEAHTPAPQLTPQQVIEAEKRDSALDSAESLFGAATNAAKSMFGAFMQRM